MEVLCINEWKWNKELVETLLRKGIGHTGETCRGESK
jgi:hypothetical protein